MIMQTKKSLQIQSDISLQISLQMQDPSKTIIFFLKFVIYNFIKMGGHQDDDDSYQQSSEDQKEEKIEIRKPKVERLDKFKTLKKIVINVSMTQYPVVVEVAEELNWKIQYSNDAGDWDVFWTDFAIDPDVLIKMHLFQKINHYPGIHVIARKNLLGMGLMNLRTHFPEEYNFFPLTWMLPLQYAEFRTYYESKPKGKARTYIVKPEADCQGRGIFLTRKIDDLQNGKHYVVQRYLARPFLIDGLKFDLRIYVLLCGTNPLRLYMFREGLARFATETYIEPTSSNLDKQYMHLTNYAINKNNPKFIFNTNTNNMGVGHKRSLTSVFKQLGARGLNVDQLTEKINDVVIKTIICGLPLMSHQYKCSQPEDYAGNMCFHILGLDIMLNAKGEPIVLEVNHTPSFTTDTPLDQLIKFNLIKDTLNILNINVQKKNQMFNKVKDINKERLITGKRQIFEGKEREEAIEQAQRLRDEYQSKHLGGFTKIFPTQDQTKMDKYNSIIEKANKIYSEENGSIRIKMMEKQAKRLIKEDYKQRKKEKMDQKQKDKEKETVSNHEKKSTIKDNVSEPVLECPSPLSPAKHNFSSEHYISHSKKQQTLSIQEQEDEQLEQSEQPQAITKSQHVIDLNTSTIQVNLVKNVSENDKKEYKHHSTIKVKKIEPQPMAREETRTKQSRMSNESKPTPPYGRKAISRDPMKNINSYTFQGRQTPSRQQRQERNQSSHTGKVLPRKNHLNLNSKGQQLPNLIDNIIATNDYGTLLRRDQRTHWQYKGATQPSSQHVASYSETKPQKKIYDHINQDIKDMISSKNINNGGYVMPKLINLNYDHYGIDKKYNQLHSEFGQRRKGNNIGLIMYSHQNQ